MRTARSNQPVIWRDVVDDLRSFKRYADEVAGWPRQMSLAEFGVFMGSETLYRQMVRELAFAGHSPNDEDDPTRMGSAFHHWIVYNAPGPRGETPLQQLRRDLRKSAAGVLKQSYDDPEFVRLGGLKQSMKMYVDALNEAVEQAAPERLSYNGFKVLNPFRVWESNLVNVFDGIDYLVSLFKKRGVEPLLREGVKTIRVIKKGGWIGKGYGRAAGYYISSSKTIEVVATTTTAKMKMLDNFMHELFVHEFGHHVHMTHMDASGREAWDAGWEFVDKAQSDLNSKISVTPADRHRFFDLIERSGWSPQKAGRKVKGLDRLKYLMWLYKTQGSPVISTPNQVRLTSYGKAVFDFFRDPEAAVEDEMRPDRILARRTRSYKSTLALTPYYDDSNTPMLDAATVEKIRAEDRSVDDALDALGIPTAYGRTNVKEDFAETFVLWMVHPDRLSEQARNRMGRALWLSGFYGKPVMRVAREADPLVDWDASKVRYRAKVSGDEVLVRAYYGRKRVGWMSAIPKSYPENNDTLCDDDVRALVDQHPHLVVREWQRSDGTVWRQIPTLVVYKAFIEDDAYHGKGIGKGMYEAVMREWYKKGGPFVFIPYYCTIGSGTSSMAKRVWDSLARRFPSVGHAVAVLKSPSGSPSRVAGRHMAGRNAVGTFYKEIARTTKLAGEREMESSNAKRVASRWLAASRIKVNADGVRTAKDLPKNVERYVQEGKDQGLDEGEAWAVAWSRYCVAGDTYIHTSMGMMTVAELEARAAGRRIVHGDGVVAKEVATQVASHNGVAETSHVINTGVKPVVRVKTKHNFTLTCTPDHKLLALNTDDYSTEWVEAGQCEGRYLVLPTHGLCGTQTMLPKVEYTPKVWNNVIPLRQPTEMTYDLARVLGYLVSEGSITQEGVEFSNADPQVVEDYTRCMTSLFGEAPKVIWLEPNESHRRVTRAAKVRSRTRWYREFFSALGLTPGVAQDKEIPHAILNAPKRFVVEFLRSFIEGDGFTGDDAHKNRVDLATSSHALARQLHLVLANLGVLGTLEKTRRGYYNVRIHSAPMVRRFVDVVGGGVFKKVALNESRKRLRGSEFECVPASGITSLHKAIANRFPGSSRVSLSRVFRNWGVLEAHAGGNVILDNLRDLRDQGYLFDPASVEPAGEAEVYDITVPGDSSFVADGLLAHNCKYKNPGSPHCKKDRPSDYLQNQGKKKAGGW